MARKLEGLPARWSDGKKETNKKRKEGFKKDIGKTSTGPKKTRGYVLFLICPDGFCWYNDAPNIIIKRKPVLLLFTFMLHVPKYT